jgi:hypothetical protein
MIVPWPVLWRRWLTSVKPWWTMPVLYPVGSDV